MLTTPAQSPKARALRSPRRPDGGAGLRADDGDAELPGMASLPLGEALPPSGRLPPGGESSPLGWRDGPPQYRFVEDDETCALDRDISGVTLTLPERDISGVSAKSSRSTVTITPGARWQREHSTQWKGYSDGVHRKIEAAFLAGESKVRLKLLRPKGDELKEDHPYPMVEVFFEDMIQYDPWNDCRHRVRRVGPKGLLFHARWALGRLRHLADTGQWRLETQQEYECRRDKVAENVVNLLEKREEDVHTFWMRQKGKSLTATASCRSFSSSLSFNMENRWARLAAAQWFFWLSMLFVVLNALWIWVDTDMNDGASFVEANLEVQVIEVTFCAYFSAELLIRWKAYEFKAQALSDRWFLFDAVLVFFMIAEVVVVPVSVAIVHADTSSPGSDIAVFRTLRLLRLSRMARLLRAIPELMMLIRGIKASLRTVSFTVILLSGLLFIFAVFFKTQVKDHPLEDQKFPSVFKSMMTLLMHGTLLDSPRVLYLEISDEWPELLVAYLIFIFLSSFTLLNMLIGILCDVVQKVSDKHHSDVDVKYLTDNLLNILEDFDTSGDRHISRDEFNVLMQSPETHDVLNKFGTDPESLILLADQIYDRDADGLLSFKEFFDVVMRLRGGDSARVKDVVDLRIFVAQQMEGLGRQIGESRRGSPEIPGFLGLSTKAATRTRGSQDTMGRLSEDSGSSAGSQASSAKWNTAAASEARAAFHRGWRLLSQPRDDDRKFSLSAPLTPHAAAAAPPSARPAAQRRSDLRFPSLREASHVVCATPGEAETAAPPEVGVAEKLDEILAGVRALQDGQRALKAEVASLWGAVDGRPPRSWPPPLAAATLVEQVFDYDDPSPSEAGLSPPALASRLPPSGLAADPAAAAE